MQTKAAVLRHFEDFADLRILNISSLNIIVSKRFSIGIDLTMRYNSRPPGAVETLDTKSSTSLAYRW